MSESKRFLFLTQMLILLPLIWINLSGVKKIKSLNKDHAELERLSKRWNLRYQINTQNDQIKRTYQSVDPAYLHTKLESLSLSEGSEQVQFIEKELEKNSFFQERKEILGSKISVDFEDLKTILDRIEGPTRRKPHLIITDFTLKKKGGLEDNLYDLDLELIKRDYLF